MVYISRHDITPEPQWPVLDRAAFLIDRASVPKYVPRYCPEAAQILSAMVACLDENRQTGGGSNV